VRIRRAIAALRAVRALVLELPDVILYPKHLPVSLIAYTGIKINSHLQVVGVHVHRVDVSRTPFTLNLVHVLAAFDVKRISSQTQRVRTLSL